MSKEEIKEYLKRIDELGNKLTGKDKETYAWLIYGYNQCAKLLNETEQQCKKQKEVIDMVSARLEYFLIGNLKYQSSQEEFIKLLNILKGVENE